MREIYRNYLDDEDGEEEDKGRQPDMPMTSNKVWEALRKAGLAL